MIYTPYWMKILFMIMAVLLQVKEEIVKVISRTGIWKRIANNLESVVDKNRKSLN